MRRALAAGVALLGLAVSAAASAAPVDTLREFVRDVKSGHAQFTQTVTSPDGVKKKTSSGSFMPIKCGGRKLKMTSPAAAIETVIVRT